MPSSGGIRAGRAFIELGVDDKIDAGLKTVQSRLAAFGAGVTSLGFSFVAVGAAISAAMDAATVAFSTIGTGIDNMSKRTGIAVETLFGLRFAADQANVGMESLELGIKKMQKTIFAAQEGTKAAVETLSELAIPIEQIIALAPEDQFKLMADAISKLGDPTQKAALAMKVFGRSGTDLLPLIEQGAAGIDAFTKKARQLGLVMSKQDAAAANVLNGALGELKQVLQQTALEVGASLAKVWTDFARQITAVVIEVNSFIRKNREMIVVAYRIATALTIAGGALVAAGLAISAFSSVVSQMAPVLHLVTGSVGLLGSLFGAMLSPVSLAFKALFALVTGPFLLLPKLLGLIVAPIGLVISGLTSMAGILYSLVSPAIRLVIGTISTLFSVLGTFFSILLPIGAVFEALAAIAAILATVLVGPLLGAIIAIGANIVLLGAVAAAVGIPIALMMKAAELASNAWGSVTIAVSGAAGSIKAAGAQVRGFASQASKAVRGSLTTSANWITSTFSRVRGAVAAIVSNPGAVWGWVTSGFAAARAALGPAIAWMKVRFVELKDFTVHVFHGISDALAAGDIALAAGILWDTLKVIWTKGVLELATIWNQLSPILIASAIRGWFGVVSIAQTAWGMLKVGWVELVTFLQTKWYSFTSTVIGAFGQMTTALLSNLATLRYSAVLAFNALKRTFNPTLKGGIEAAVADARAMKQLVADRKAITERRKEFQKLADDQAKMGNQAANNLPAAKGSIEAETAAALAETQKGLKEALEKARQAAASGLVVQIAPLQAALEQAQKDLDDAIAKAKDERAKHDAEVVAAPGAPGGIGAFFADAKDKIAAAGTFSAVGAGGLGGQAPISETLKKSLKAQEAANVLHREILAAAKGNRPLVFQ